ncbi:similar to Saccharomyces cerevisiae YNL078W NIS1 Protein localized in the bud neck at G2/M phase [Maudiozyma saulgeensis]|uniref:Similar to Saccharomyces cerevisiae YNL078W NIS1 Protein localized in the bud neck at G2/M phase n=1 Tax=Maudiozyma saulgeensis TaxID=1789683 RepID=A0A1X7R069_9SACH|nr:similar to Saccharomyces cerevisiae YNL078W NIS1 Protein localized in the bud neck at G2/M phase [Kazachstania saulgeensis]
MIHRHGYHRISSQESALSQVSNWDQYQQQQQKSSVISNNSKINIQPYTNDSSNNIKRRHSSRRHKDFTTQREINQNKNNNFLFPRGFITLKKKSTKSLSQKQINSKFKNVNELKEMMNLINLRTLETNEVLPLPRIASYNINSKNSINAQVSSMTTVSRNIYKRQPSIKRIYIPMNETQIRLLNLKRSNTMPTQQRNFKKKLRSKEEEDKIKSQRQLHSLWEQYLRAVIHQRIQLRLELMKVQSISSLQTRDNNSELRTMIRSRKGDNRDNPIIIPDDLSIDSRRKIY